MVDWYYWGAFPGGGAGTINRMDAPRSRSAAPRAEAPRVAAPGGSLARRAALAEAEHPPASQSSAVHSKAFMRLVHELAGSFELGGLLNSIAEQAVACVGAETAAVLLVSRDLRHLEPVACAGTDRELARRLCALSPDLIGLTDVLKEQRSVVCPDAGEAGGRDAMCAIVRADICRFSPIVHHGRSIGLLVVTKDGQSPWGTEESVFLDALAQVAAVAVHHIRVTDESERWASQLAVVQASMARLNRLNTVASIGQAIVDETQQFVDYHNCRVYLLQPGGLLEPIAFGGEVGTYDEITVEMLRTRLGEGITGWVAEHNEPTLVNDANADPRTATIPGTEDVDESMIVAPMRFENDVIGVIALAKLGLNQFDERDLRLITVLSDAAATAIESARASEEVRRREREMRSLLEMSSAVALTLDPVRIAEVVASHVQAALDADVVRIATWNEGAGTVETLVVRGDEETPPFEPHEDIASYPDLRFALFDQHPVILSAEEPESDAPESARLRQLGLETSLIVPLLAKGQAIGIVEVATRDRRTFDMEAVHLATTMANEAAMALENARLYEEARSLADRDPLTNFYNHRYLHERLGEEILRARRARRPLAVLMLDLDDFKLVNDTLGHQMGDQVLRWSADLIRSTLRESDVAARYGGDEFAIILPEEGGIGAASAADRIVTAFARHAFHASERGEIPIGATIGIAAFPEDGRTANELIAAADAVLYQAKRSVGHAGSQQGGGTAEDEAGGDRRREPNLARGHEPDGAALASASGSASRPAR